MLKVKNRKKFSLNIITKESMLGIVAHACNFSYSRGRDQEDLGSRPPMANKNLRTMVHA
jgi:hypothetical protein